MPLKLAEIDELLAAAYAAINVGELSFTAAGGRQVAFHSLDAFTRYIDWLERGRAQVVGEAAAASGDPASAAPVVRFQEARP